MKWAGYVADMGKMTNGNKTVVRKPERKDYVRLILKWLLKNVTWKWGIN
jgi:hypothetical protein